MPLDSQNELVSLLDWVRWGASQFNKAKLRYGHGTTNAFDEAAYLVLHSINLAPSIPDAYWQSRLTADEKQKINALFELRISSRKPASYLTNEAWFMQLPFFVDERVLVPRSPIAELIEQHFSPWVKYENVTHILDLCTGSGCIGIATALQFPFAKVDLSDISQDAIDVANINIARYCPNEERIQTFVSDLFEHLAHKKYDIIVSNPPYVDQFEMNLLTDEFRHEPTIGLASGNDGLDCTRKILQQAKQHLTENGILIVEVGNSAEALIQQYPDLPFVWLEFERGGQGVFLLQAKDLT